MSHPDSSVSSGFGSSSLGPKTTHANSACLASQSVSVDRVVRVRFSCPRTSWIVSDTEWKSDHEPLTARIPSGVFIPKGFKTVAGGKPHRSGATTGFERRNGPTILKGLQIVLYPAVRSAIPSALDRFVGACNPVVRYRDHRLISEAPFGANSLRVRTPAMI